MADPSEPSKATRVFTGTNLAEELPWLLAVVDNLDVVLLDVPDAAKMTKVLQTLHVKIEPTIFARLKGRIKESNI